jgi:hypothetical protein
MWPRLRSIWASCSSPAVVFLNSLLTCSMTSPLCPLLDSHQTKEAPTAVSIESEHTHCDSGRGALGTTGRGMVRSLREPPDSPAELHVERQRVAPDHKVLEPVLCRATHPFPFLLPPPWEWNFRRRWRGGKPSRGPGFLAVDFIGMGEPTEDAITLKSVTIEPNECPLGSELRIKIEFKYVAAVPCRQVERCPPADFSLISPSQVQQGNRKGRVGPQVHG